MGMSLLDEMQLLLMTQEGSLLCQCDHRFLHDLSPGRSSSTHSTTVLQKHNAIVEYFISHT